MIEYNELSQMAGQVSARLGHVNEICERVNKENSMQIKEAEIDRIEMPAKTENSEGMDSW